MRCTPKSITIFLVKLHSIPVLPFLPNHRGNNPRTWRGQRSSRSWPRLFCAVVPNKKGGRSRPEFTRCRNSQIMIGRQPLSTRVPSCTSRLRRGRRSRPFYCAHGRLETLRLERTRHSPFAPALLSGPGRLYRSMVSCARKCGGLRRDGTCTARTAEIPFRFD